MSGYLALLAFSDFGHSGFWRSEPAPLRCKKCTSRQSLSGPTCSQHCRVVTGQQFASDDFTLSRNNNSHPRDMSSTAKPPGPTNKLRETIESSLPEDKQESPRTPHVKAQGGKPLTVKELLAHPEYPHVNWQLLADKEGRIDVAAGRGGPFKLAYELHGHGPSKILV